MSTGMAGSGNESLRRPPFYVLVLVAIYLSYLVLGPFLVPLAWAAVFAMIVSRLHRSSSRRRLGRNRAALCQHAADRPADCRRRP